MGPPGGLDEMGSDARAAWNVRAGTVLRGVLTELARTGTRPELLTTDLGETPELRAPDWPGYPARVGACVGRDRALALFDWRPDGEGDVGRIRHQEEYLEWRVVREGGRIRRIEMTSEFSDYWGLLAGHEPARTLELVAQFAGEEEVETADVYGPLDPFAAGVSVDERQTAFAQTMLPAAGDDRRQALVQVSAYNDGRSAICCMIHPNNTLHALIALVASAARPLLVCDPVTGQPRHASGSEAILALEAAAQDGRNSDPLVVERVARVATERRRIAFDDPVGVYIRSVQHHELEQPDGRDVPASWFEFGRGLRAAEAPDGAQRCQRLTLTLPSDADFMLDDLVVRRSGDRLRFGGQLAALAQLTAYVRTGPREGAVVAEPSPCVDPPAANCAEELASLEEMAG